MAEYFLRKDLAEGALGFAGDADTLLRWATAVAEEAPAKAVYRDRDGRKTLRLQLQGRHYFLKLHSGVGWAEILKNLFQARLPVLGARNEYRAVRRLNAIGVDTLALAAYASRGLNPARKRSMVLSDALTATTSLEDYCADWGQSPPPFRERVALTVKLAEIARHMHAAGINHRDFYLCHFHLEEASLTRATPRCHLIDLHRAQLRRLTPRRWRIKDLAGLYFSAMDCGLTRRDRLRFIRHYQSGGLRAALGEQARFWRQVEERAAALYRKGNVEAVTPGGKAGA